LIYFSGIFYSITSTQTGLQGIELGTFLIKQAVQRLKDEFPEMNQFSTLSPIPGFRAWLLTTLQSAKKGEVKVFTEAENSELEEYLSR
jgi:malonyl-CoA decarboxylase